MKIRLTGAFVLASLAVIFVPMILDGGGDPDPTVAEGIPPRPNMDFEPLEIPLQVPIQPAEAPKVVERDDPEPPAAPAQAPAAKPAPEAKPTPDPAPKPAADHEPPAVAKPAPAEEDLGEQPDPDVKGWVVQVGSFSRSSNALGLRDKLREQGFATFVERHKTASATAYRVRVGPEMDKAKADSLRKRLKEKAGLAGLVMEYP